MIVNFLGPLPGFFGREPIVAGEHNFTTHLRLLNIKCILFGDNIETSTLF